MYSFYLNILFCMLVYLKLLTSQKALETGFLLNTQNAVRLMLLTLTLSGESLKSLHLRRALSTGSLASSHTLWVVMGGKLFLWAAKIHRFSLTVSSLSRSSSASGRRPLEINEDSTFNLFLELIKKQDIHSLHMHTRFSSYGFWESEIL